LERGHGHGEKQFCQHIWWELKGNFDALHPEYEVTDWRGKSYFADFDYKVPGSKATLLWEIKGFNSHVKEMDRNKFYMECKRELYLEALGFRVISIAYEDLESNPRLIISLIRSLQREAEKFEWSNMS
jgi:very-short-patch-repair endonuclease